MDEGFGRRLLHRGNLLLLLDGLDEVADEEKRERVSRWIDGAQQFHDSCRCVVTCRFAGYTAGSRLSERFMELHIRPLTDEQAVQFVTNWYRIVERGLAIDPSQGEIIGQEKASELIESLRQPDFRSRRVYSMTRNPLLLANLCLVHYDRKKLPQRRSDLYEECVDVLLERWRDAKHLQSSITAKTGRRVLQPAALWLHQEENRTRAKADELARVIDPMLKTTEYDKGDAKQFLKTVRDESGILVGWGDESYGFMHLGFQEYLAAREIGQRSYHDKSILKQLAGHYGESWWQEVSLLLLALEEFPCFEPFMRELVKTPGFIEHKELIETYLDDAIAFSEAPFIELVEASPGRDKGLWQRQLLALQILEGRKSEKLGVIKKQLKAHPSPEIHSWLSGQKTKAEQRMIHAEQGGYDLVLIPGGVFQMGSPKSEEGRNDSEGPVHKVKVRSFYLGRCPVTNEEYGRFLSANRDIQEPRYWGDRRFNQPRQPVVGVSWDEARAYATWAGLRLPSESEWEYACRAGTTTPFYFGGTINPDQANYDGNYSYGKGKKGEYRQQTTPVNTFPANAFGLYDMHGNVWEWIEDDWHENYKGALSDGQAWINNPRGEGRVLRGGSWLDDPLLCRSAYRLRDHPVGRGSNFGFRLALDFH
jgi:formylglycine-generating enzyme required for sulfatase activity